MLRRIEILRHAAFAAHAMPERDALQTSGEIVAPRMVDAGQRLGVAPLLQAHQCPFMGATIDHRMDRTVLIAGHHDRRFANSRETPITGIGNFDVQTEEIPDRPAEQALLLLRIDRGIREDAERHARHPICWPDEVGRNIASDRDVHRSPPRALPIATVAVSRVSVQMWRRRSTIRQRETTTFGRTKHDWP